MERTKRQRENSICDNNKKKNLTINANSVSIKSITHFEDLSNEIIYEVFEFLDFYRVYEAFFDLNIRFQNLLTHSNFPINIDLSLKSKRNLQFYYENILIPYQHRIKSLHLSNPLIIERIFSSSLDTSLAFTRLEKLTLHNIISIHLEQVLTHFIFASCLFSLDITCIDIVQDERNLYRQIFRLPRLKYCKLLCEQYISHRSIPVATNEYSSIEYLVIKHELGLHEVNALLSYVPQLRRLSLICESSLSDTQTVSYSIVLNHLTHLYLKIHNFLFDQFEFIMKNLFHLVQILHIGIWERNDGTYYDANRWKQFILTSLSYLRIFNINISISDDRRSHNNIKQYISRIDEFNSSFWIERQWFFQHGVYRGTGGIDYLLYSINPYRTKDAALHGSTDEYINANGQKCNMDSVVFVDILNEIELNNYRYYFPNATTLKTSYHSFCERRYSSFDSTNLNRIIPLEKLTTLDINLSGYRLSNIIEILQHTPNIHTLNITSMSNYNRESILVKKNENFRLVSQTNKIQKMKIVSFQALDTTKFLVTLCPRLKQLMLGARLESLMLGHLFGFVHSTIRRDEDSFKTLLQFLLSKDNNNTRYLSSLLIESDRIETVKTFIESEKLHDISFIEVQKPTGSIIYLWW